MPLFVNSGYSASAIELNAPNCISIGLINNMPDAALAATERQFTDLIRAATPNVVVLLKLFAMSEVPRGEGARRVLAERYRDVSALWDTPLDGLIVTGTEPRAKNLTDEPYWETLSKVVDWARDHTSSTIWSCLAAHAAVLHADGIERRAAQREALRGIRLPARRRSSDDRAFPRAAVGAAFALQRLARRGARGLRLQGSHPLAERGRRYFRQAGRQLLFIFSGSPGIRGGLAVSRIPPRRQPFLGKRARAYPVLPVGYFSDEAAASAEAFRARALADRRAELAAEFPTTALETGLQWPWRAAALGVYEKWCEFLSARKAERRVRRRPSESGCAGLGATGRSARAGCRRSRSMTPGSPANLNHSGSFTLSSAAALV